MKIEFRTILSVTKRIGKEYEFEKIFGGIKLKNCCK